MNQQQEIQFIQKIIDEAPLSKAERDKANMCLKGILSKYSDKIKEQQQQIEKLQNHDGSREETEDSREVPQKD